MILGMIHEFQERHRLEILRMEEAQRQQIQQRNELQEEFRRQCEIARMHIRAMNAARLQSERAAATAKRLGWGVPHG